MLKSLSSSLIVRGLLALGVGTLALAWPGVTVFALVVMFAVYAFAAACLHAALAFGSSSAKPVAGHLLLGFIDVCAGALALAWPGVTALVLALLLAGWAVAAGAVQIYAALQRGETAGTRALFILGGLASVAFGFVLFARPDMGVYSLALLFGLFNLISGTSLLMQGIELRSFDSSLRSLVQPGREHSTV